VCCRAKAGKDESALGVYDKLASAKSAKNGSTFSYVLDTFIL
jgi:hypothetical protein